MSEDIPKAKIIKKVLRDDLKTDVFYSIQHDLRDPALYDALKDWATPAKQLEKLSAELRQIHEQAISYLAENGFAAQGKGLFFFPAGHKEADFSLIWYAAEVANESFMLLHREGKSDDNFNYLDMRRSFKLGQLVAEWNFRGNHEKRTRGGIKSYRGAAFAGKDRARKHDAENKRIIKKMKPLIEKGLSVKSAAAIVAKDEGKTESGIRSIWYREKKNTSDAK